MNSKSDKLKAFVIGIEKILSARADSLPRAELELAETLNKVIAKDKLKYRQSQDK